MRTIRYQQLAQLADLTYLQNRFEIVMCQTDKKKEKKKETFWNTGTALLTDLSP